MRPKFFMALVMCVLAVSGVSGSEEVQWVRVTALLETAPDTPGRAEANLVPGGVYSTAEVGRLGQNAVDAEILKRVRFLTGEIEAVERSMRLGRLAPRQYYLPLEVGRDAVLPVIDLNPRLGVVFTPLKLEDGQLVCRVRFLEPEGPQGAKTYTGDPITLALKDADIKDVLKTFSVVTGINIALDPLVEGKVTVELRNIPWDQALDVVLRTNDLGVEAEGDVLRVVPLDELSRRRRVRTEATIRLPRGGSGSATIASRGDDVNRTVVIVVESVARGPELVAERDGLLHPPAFAVVKAKASDGTAPGEVVVFRGTATAAGDLEGVDVLGDPGGKAAAALREAVATARPWTVLDRQVRRIDAVVGYGLRLTEATPSLEPVHVAVAERIGIEVDVKPAPPKVAGESQDFYVVSVYLRDLESGEIISAPRITFRKGEEATVRSGIPEPDGGTSLVEMKFLIADDGSRLSYSWTVTSGGKVVSSNTAEFEL
jgi:hypothetical protein